MRKPTIIITLFALTLSGCGADDSIAADFGDETGDLLGPNAQAGESWNMCKDASSGALSKPGFDVFDRPFCVSGTLVSCWDDPISGTVCEDDYEPTDVGLTVSQASGLGSAGMCCRLYIKPTMTDGSGGGPGLKCHGTDDHNACATWLACPPGETFNTDGGCNAGGDALGSCCGGASDKPADALAVVQ